MGLETAAQRTVVAEMDSALESGACLIDDAGRQRALEIAAEIRARCSRLSRPEKLQKLQSELQKAALGQQEWQQPAAEPNLGHYHAEPSRSTWVRPAFAWGLACLVAGATIAVALRGRRKP